jgi:hypothetical protein
LRGAIRRHATRHHFPFGTRHDAAAHRTLLRHLETLLRSHTPRLNHFEHFRDHVAALFDKHPIADAHVEPFDLVFVVQGGAGDGAARDEHRLKMRDGRERARAPDLHVYV